jgi:hypothetical protein
VPPRRLTDSGLANPLDVISVRPLGPALAEAVSTSLPKTEHFSCSTGAAAHLDQPNHVNDQCTIHCLEGDIRS